MSLIWNQPASKDFGAHLPGSGKLPKEAMLRFDDKWKAVAKLSDHDLVSMSPSDVAAYAGLSVSEFDRIIRASLEEWRENPGRSFLNVIDQAASARPGKRMFSDLVFQTKVLSGLCRVGGHTPGMLQAVRSKEHRFKFHKEGAITAITASEVGEAEINDLARAFRVWERRNAALVKLGDIKLPKRLYRGVRSHNLDFPDLGVVRDDGTNHWVHSANVLQARYDHLLKHPFSEVSAGNILSFTTSQSIARMFANEEGFVIGVDPKEVGVVACWLMNEELDGDDPNHGRHEKEWIVRIAPELQLSPDNIEIADVDWLMVNSDYRAIAMAAHAASARYEMNGRKITSTFQYKGSGVGGSVRYQVDGDWMAYGRNEFKRVVGFDPVPKAADQVKKLEYWSYEEFSSRPQVKISVEKPGLELSINEAAPRPR